MEDLVSNPLTYAALAVLILRGLIRLLRDAVELRNEWHTRER
jgi:hypothetical protein